MGGVGEEGRVEMGNELTKGHVTNEGADVERTFVAFVRADEVNLQQGGAGVIASGGGVSVYQGGSGPVLANGPVSYTQGGSGPVLANGDVSFHQGGSSAVLALGDASLQRSWVGAVANLRAVAIGDRSRVGIVLAPHVTVEDGGRVVATTRSALAFGAALGVAVGVTLGAMLVKAAIAAGRQ